MEICKECDRPMALSTKLNKDEKGMFLMYSLSYKDYDVFYKKMQVARESIHVKFRNLSRKESAVENFVKIANSNIRSCLAFYCAILKGLRILLYAFKSQVIEDISNYFEWYEQGLKSPIWKVEWFLDLNAWNAYDATPFIQK